MRTLSGRYYYHHCAIEETEAQTVFFNELAQGLTTEPHYQQAVPRPKLHPIRCSLRVVLVFPSLKLETITDPSMKAKRLS